MAFFEKQKLNVFTLTVRPSVRRTQMSMLMNANDAADLFTE